MISRRSANRPSNPLKWETVGGSVIKGEGSLEGALREAKEEVGLDLQPENGKILFRKVRDVIDGWHFGDILYVWQFSYDGECDLQNATTDEVCETKWLYPAGQYLCRCLH